MANTFWRFVRVAGKYNVWQSITGEWQVTQTMTPPDTTAGYGDLSALLKLKGVKNEKRDDSSK